MYYMRGKSANFLLGGRGGPFHFHVFVWVY